MLFFTCNLCFAIVRDECVFVYLSHAQLMLKWTLRIIEYSFLSSLQFALFSIYNIQFISNNTASSFIPIDAHTNIITLSLALLICHALSLSDTYVDMWLALMLLYRFIKCYKNTNTLQFMWYNNNNVNFSVRIAILLSLPLSLYILLKECMCMSEFVYIHNVVAGLCERESFS